MCIIDTVGEGKYEMWGRLLYCGSVADRILLWCVLCSVLDFVVIFCYSNFHFLSVKERSEIIKFVVGKVLSLCFVV